MNKRRKNGTLTFFSCIKSLEKSEATASGFSFACKMKKIKFAVRIFIFYANSRVYQDFERNGGKILSYRKKGER